MHQILQFAHLLKVLVELLANLRTQCATRWELDGELVIKVNMSGFSEFISEVNSRHVFVTCMARCRLHFLSGGIYVDVDSNWVRSSEPDSDTAATCYAVQQVLQEQLKVDKNGQDDSLAAHVVHIPLQSSLRRDVDEGFTL